MISNIKHFIAEKALITKLFKRKRDGGSWSFKFAVILVVAALVSGFATYAAMTRASGGEFPGDTNNIVWLLNINLIILLLLAVLIARRLVGLFSGHRRGLAGSRLHVRLVYIFAFLAAMPAIIMTVFSAFFFHFGIQSWFSERVSTAVNESQAVAEAYLEEHKQVIRADILAMASDLDRQASILIANSSALDKIVSTQSLLRNFSEALVFDRNGRVLARSGFTFTLAFEDLPSYALPEADRGEVIVTTGASDDRVRALVKLHNFLDAYLFVGRMVDPTVLSHLSATKQAVEEYEALEIKRSDVQLTFTMIFVVVALLLVLAAIWGGLAFARQMVVPIGALINAADKVRAGDLSARVPDFQRQDEFDTMGRAFNRMTKQIKEQRDDLVKANLQLDHRRRFTETVLAGVSSGVIGVDKNGVINLSNASAQNLFQKKEKDITGANIAELLPEVEPLLLQAHEKPAKIAQAEIPFLSDDGAKRTLLVRIGIETIGDKGQGAVLTFDDITEFQSAQRKAAWADVARRIAHEIKNPLTPIQLSAERLQKRYLSQISKEPEIFTQCTNTIIHHVEDIGRMVDEFSTFARMPTPVMKPRDLLKNIADVVVFQQQAHPHIIFNRRGLAAGGFQADEIITVFDAQQIRQALTNILQNAIESVSARVDAEKEMNQKNVNIEPGHIDVLLTQHDDDYVLAVTDNGLGLPKDEDPSRLMEPYVTHRERGTGLGLAIVRKIMEDHEGALLMGAPKWLKSNKDWKDYGGATVYLVLPKNDGDRGQVSVEAA